MVPGRLHSCFPTRKPPPEAGPAQHLSFYQFRNNVASGPVTPPHTSSPGARLQESPGPLQEARREPISLLIPRTRSEREGGMLAGTCEILRRMLAGQEPGPLADCCE